MESSLHIVHDDLPGHAPAISCPSCHTAASGNFCSGCGESTHAHPPSAGEFIHEFVGHYVALEGKLWSTLRLLLLRPGQLTADYLRGRRVPYINPLRLYLTLSLVMFALIKMFGIGLPQVLFDNKTIGVAYAHSVPNPARPGKDVTATLYLQYHDTEGTDLTSVPEAIARLEQINATWARNVRQFMRAPAQERAELLDHGFLANLPYMLIGALPLFALYLKLIHWRAGRRYGEHLVFALHVSAFAFLLASVMILVPGNFGWMVMSAYSREFGLISPWDYLQLLPVVWMVAYLPAAMRRVYGGSALVAWGKSAVVATMHLTVILCLVVGAEAIAVLKHA